MACLCAVLVGRRQNLEERGDEPLPLLLEELSRLQTIENLTCLSEMGRLDDAVVNDESVCLR